METVSAHPLFVLQQKGMFHMQYRASPISTSGYDQPKTIFEVARLLAEEHNRLDSLVAKKNDIEADIDTTQNNIETLTEMLKKFA